MSRGCAKHQPDDLHFHRRQGYRLPVSSFSNDAASDEPVLNATSFDGNVAVPRDNSKR
jgi:hypothetical protein